MLHVLICKQVNGVVAVLYFESGVVSVLNIDRCVVTVLYIDRGDGWLSWPSLAYV